MKSSHASPSDRFRVGGYDSYEHGISPVTTLSAKIALAASTAKPYEAVKFQFPRNKLEITKQKRLNQFDVD